MTPQLNTKLNKTFPWLQITIECDDGWYNLIYECLKEIEVLYKTKSEDISEIKVLQIKEKYAHLRIYIFSYIGDVYDIIDKYESLSHNICEHCGNDGELSVKYGYYRVLCEKCRNELSFELAERSK